MARWQGRKGRAAGPSKEPSPLPCAARKEPRPLRPETTSASFVELRPPGSDPAGSRPSPRNPVGGRRAGLLAVVTRAEGWGRAGRPRLTRRRGPRLRPPAQRPRLPSKRASQTLEGAVPAPAVEPGRPRPRVGRGRPLPAERGPTAELPGPDGAGFRHQRLEPQRFSQWPERGAEGTPGRRHLSEIVSSDESVLTTP